MTQVGEFLLAAWGGQVYRYGAVARSVPPRHVADACGGAEAVGWASHLCPLTLAAPAAGVRFSRHGKVFDAYGDVAVNDGAAGHATRHYLILRALYDGFRRAWGGQVQREAAG